MYPSLHDRRRWGKELMNLCFVFNYLELMQCFYSPSRLLSAVASNTRQNGALGGPLFYRSVFWGCIWGCNKWGRQKTKQNHALPTEILSPVEALCWIQANVSMQLSFTPCACKFPLLAHGDALTRFLNAPQSSELNEWMYILQAETS